MKNTKPKVRLWSVLTGLTAILTVAAIVGNIIANQYATTINVALNASTYKIIHGENTGDTEYFKKGFASDEEREAYEAELCATVEAEGAALLKNENNALPLASGAKVSLFGHGSVQTMSFSSHFQIKILQRYIFCQLIPNRIIFFSIFVGDRKSVV